MAYSDCDYLKINSKAGLFKDPLDINMPKVNYNFACFKVTHHSVKKALKVHGVLSAASNINSVETTELFQVGSCDSSVCLNRVASNIDMSIFTIGAEERFSIGGNESFNTGITFIPSLNEEIVVKVLTDEDCDVKVHRKFFSGGEAIQLIFREDTNVLVGDILAKVFVFRKAQNTGSVQFKEKFVAGKVASLTPRVGLTETKSVLRQSDTKHPKLVGSINYIQPSSSTFNSSYSNIFSVNQLIEECAGEKAFSARDNAIDSNLHQHQPDGDLLFLETLEAGDDNMGGLLANLNTVELVPTIQHLGSSCNSKEFVVSFSRATELCEVQCQQGGSKPKYVHTGEFADVVNTMLGDFSKIQDDVRFDPNLARCGGYTHDVSFPGSVKPFRAKPFRLSPVETEQLKILLEKYQKNNWIKVSNSPWAAPIFLVPKKTVDPVTGMPEYRLIIDYRKMNEQSVKLAYPLPKPDELLNSIKASKFFTTLDLQSGYHHIPLTDRASDATGFVSPIGHFQFNVLPFGIHSAPPSFQRCMEEILAVPIAKGYCKVYLDDVIIFSDSFKAHEKHIRSILEILQKNNMRIRPDKCEWFMKEVKYLGHIVGREGMRVDPKKIVAIAEFQRPQTLKNLQSFLGMCIQYSSYIKHYAHLTLGLTEILGTQKSSKLKNPRLVTAKEPEEDPSLKGRCLIWTEEADKSFQAIKKAMIATDSEDGILVYPNPHVEYHMYTDASDRALGGVLMQAGKPVAYFSKKLLPAETRYMVYEREALAVVKCVKKWHHLIHNNLPITVHCDNKAVTCLLKQNFTNARQARWSCFLQQYNLIFEFIPGKDNVVADAITRQYDLNVAGTWGEQCLNQVFKSLRVTMPEVRVESLSQVAACTVSKFKFPKKVSSKSDFATPTLYPVVLENSDFVQPPTVETAELQDKWREAYLLDERLAPIYKHFADDMVLVGNQADKFEYDSGFLFFEGKLAVPVTMRYNLLAMAHDEVMHCGVHKMVARLRAFWWPGMHSDCGRFSKSCLVCIRSKSKFVKSVGHEPKAIPSAFNPFERLHIDFVGPFPLVEYAGKMVNRVMTVIDSYTKLAWAIPCTVNVTAEDMCSMLMTHVIPITGVPNTIITDKGGEFHSEFTREVLRCMGSRQKFTSAYHPQTNAAIERWHRDLNVYFSIVAGKYENSTSWVHGVSMALYVHNHTMHSSLGAAPVEVAFGIMPREPVRDFLLDIRESMGSPVVPTAAGRLKILEEARRIARKTLREMEEVRSQAMKSHERRGNYLQVKVGDYVLVNTSRRSPLPRKKFQPKFIGPFQVVEVKDQVVKLDLLQSKMDNTVNKKDIVIFNDEFAVFAPAPIITRTLKDDEQKLEFLRKSAPHLTNTAEFQVMGKNVIGAVSCRRKQVGVLRTKTLFDIWLNGENDKITLSFEELVLQRNKKHLVHNCVVKLLLRNIDLPVWTEIEARRSKTVKLREEVIKMRLQIKAETMKLKHSPHLFQPKVKQRLEAVKKVHNMLKSRELAETIKKGSNVEHSNSSNQSNSQLDTSKLTHAKTQGGTRLTQKAGRVTTRTSQTKTAPVSVQNSGLGMRPANRRRKI
ncbi:MAG: hypothetical protein DHS20C17_31460 [Cyclobacteriaceae bacterium]|nr:MAG: hypothetical protein DHS20C17_31460 [Cyclobacteriaceae bacterium]